MENGYKKISFVTQDVSAAYFKNKLSQEYPVFVKYKELVTNQYAMVHEIKALNEETCTVQMDFADNSFQPMVKKSSPLTSTKTPSHYVQL